MNLYIVTSSCILISRHDMYLVLSAFTSRPISLLAITKASVFFFIVHMLPPNVLAWSSVIWTRKLTYIFLISVQLEAHSSLWGLTRKLRTTIYPSDFYHRILSIILTQGGLLSTSHINFSTSSTIDIAVRRKKQGLCTLLHLASNCSVDIACLQIETCASDLCQQQLSVASRMGQAATGCKFSFAATQMLPALVISYKAAFSIRATK